MKPRIFISSTYYDLKYVRESLDRFIKSFGFDPILFENGAVTFQHNKHLDESCYNEVDTCHMMILIIGGRYGSAATGKDKTTKEEMDEYEKNYVSITQRECETALKNNIPIFIFVEKSVFNEYETFCPNREVIETMGDKYKLAHVDNLNIFKFIDAINKKPIKTFERIDDIEDYLRQQLAGMFFHYLEILKNKSQNERLLDAVNEINNITHRMNTMLQKVGEKVIDKKEYEDILDKQDKNLIDNYVAMTPKWLKFGSIDVPKKDIKSKSKKLAEAILNLISNESQGFSKQTDIYVKELNNIQIECIKITYEIIYRYISLIRPLIEKNKDLKAYFEEELEKVAYKIIENGINKKSE